MKVVCGTCSKGGHVYMECTGVSPTEDQDLVYTYWKCPNCSHRVQVIIYSVMEMLMKGVNGI